jgi:proline dehydrogenase
MEDSSLTQVTLDIVLPSARAPELRGSIGIVIQAYLYRSQADIEQLVAEGIRVRLCKGAYKEPAEVAFPAKADVDKNYIQLSHMLLESPIYHGLATHDEAMIAAAKAYATQHGIEPSRFEFQMLYGVRRDLQRMLVKRGLQRARLRSLWPRVVSLLHAPAGGAPANVSSFLAKNFFRARRASS